MAKQETCKAKAGQIELGISADPWAPNGEGAGHPPHLPNDEFDDDGHPKRTGTVWTGSAHAITACIGSGVLSLAWGMSQLGWIAGPLVNIAFALITYYTSLLLADSYRYKDPTAGRRLYTYMGAVRAYLGPTETFLCGVVQYVNLFGVCIGYTITASISMVAIKRAGCFHKEGRDADCHVSNNTFMIIFGATQILFSQIRDFHKISWLSVVAAIMSFTYAGIGLALSFIKAFEGGHSRGSLAGAPIGIGLGEVSAAQKSWQMLAATGDIAFAYGFIIILIEIQDTIRSPPSENKTMKRVAFVGNFTTSIFYLSVGCVGYAAFGNDAPGNLLTGFGFYDPFWLIELANVCIIVHLVGAYQVFAQPLFAFVEGVTSRKWPESYCLKKTIKVGWFEVNVFRLVWRTVFVILTTVIALLLPFFNSIMGLLGALGFFPLSVYFPVRMYMKRIAVAPYTQKWWALNILMLFCLVVSIAAACGSIEGIIDSVKRYTPFGG